MKTDKGTEMGSEQKDRLRLEQLCIGYDDHPDQLVIRNLNLSVADGEIVSMLGPSGSGKSTILKAIAGLLRQRSGRIFIDGQAVDGQPADRRDAVLIFQKPLLFPFLDVWNNIAFGLKMSGHDRATMQARVAEMVAITGLSGLERRRIHQLSGGQQQRVALARGLVLEPSILLLDEPLSSLDSELRLQMRELIRNVQQLTGTTMLFITHDQSEAFGISDRVCVLLDGTLRQIGRPEELFYHPADLDVARFFGISNILPGSIVNGVFSADCAPLQCSVANTATIATTGTHATVAIVAAVAATAVIRPEDLQISAAEPGSRSAQNVLQGTITASRFEGSVTRVTISAGEAIYTALWSRSSFQVGERVSLHFPPERMHLIL